MKASNNEKKARGSSLRVALLTFVLAALALMLFAGTASAAPPWSDAPNSWWISSYGVTDVQVGTVADGYPDGTFKPGLEVTRGQFAKMAVDGFGVSTANPATPTFSDVASGDTYFPWIEGGVAAGIIGGYPDGTFRPDSSSSRQQANSILGLHVAQKELDIRGHIAGEGGDYPSLNAWYLAEGAGILAGFADSDSVSPLHAPATAYLVYRDVVQGSARPGGLFLDPAALLVRSQAVVLILRVEAVTFPLAVPTITLVNPSSGPPVGGTSVVITGTDFTGATAVKFGTMNASSYVVNSATQITSVAPVGAAGTTVDVRVTNADGQSAVVAADTYTYVGLLPTVTALGPSGQATTAAGTAVTITGTNFVAGATVAFGGAAATGVTVVSATTITCVSPAHVAGVVDVTVTTPVGTSTTAGAGNDYAYGLLPTVSVITPHVGPIGGGTAVIITGTGFGTTANTDVTFGGLSGTVTAVSSTSITVTTPAHVAGAVEVVVTAPGGQVHEVGGFTYLAAPTVATILPDMGPTTGGTVVTITGTNFYAPGTTVTFGGTAGTGISVNPAGTEIKVTTPVHAAGAVEVVVTAPGGHVHEVGGFTYLAAPTVATILPDMGPTTGGTVVTITGTNFYAPGTTVTFGGTAGTGISVNPAGTEIKVTTPVHAAGAVEVVVTAPGGHVHEVGGFTYASAPTITQIDPDAGPTAGGTLVAMAGTYLGTTADTTVTFDGVPGTGLWVNPVGTEIKVTTPVHAAGAVEVVVTTLEGHVHVAAGFTYMGAPTISKIFPDAGPLAGLQKVTITGTNFHNTVDTSVTFDGDYVTISSITSTSITVTTPAGPHVAEHVDVVVTAPGGTATVTDGYEYVAAAAPSITLIAPDKGSIHGGTSVTITGTNFTTGGSTSVTFDGAAGTGIWVNPAGTEIKVTTPAHGVGFVDVTVGASGGTTTKAGGYCYIVPTTIILDADPWWLGSWDRVPSVEATVRDQYGNPYEGASVEFFAEVLEGAGLTFVSPPASRVLTDALGRATVSWSQEKGDWGVQRITATADGIADPTLVPAVIQWIWDSTGYLPQLVIADHSESTVTIASGQAGWAGNWMQVYDADDLSDSLGPACGTYTTAGLVMHVSDTPGMGWPGGVGHGIVVQTGSSDTDGWMNFVYQVIE